jgi:hypothetical protein
VRNYTIEAGKSLTGTFTVSGSYDLTVYARTASRAVSRAAFAVA